MPPVVRKLLILLAGIVVAVMVIMLTEQLSGRLYPMPAGMAVTDKQAMRSYVATLPLGAFLLVLLSYALGGLLGGWVMARLDRAAGRRNAIRLAAALVVASLMNLFALPHPAWFWVTNLALVVATPLLGARLAGATEASHV
jgi:uncharacterized membrane protein